MYEQPQADRPGDPQRRDKRFVVELTHAAPDVVSEVVDAALGANPIAVFREEDYARILNMDNNPTPKKRRWKGFMPIPGKHPRWTN